MCLLGLILFLIAATIVLALIPVYLRRRGDFGPAGKLLSEKIRIDSSSFRLVGRDGSLHCPLSDQQRYFARRTTDVGQLCNDSNRCEWSSIEGDFDLCSLVPQQQNIAAANRDVNPAIPQVVDCTATQNTTVSRKRQ